MEEIETFNVTLSLNTNASRDILLGDDATAEIVISDFDCMSVVYSATIKVNIYLAFHRSHD